MGPLSFEQRCRTGNCYTAASNVLNAAVATNLRATIENPADSGVNVVVYCLEAFSGSAGMAYAKIIKDPTTNKPTTLLSDWNQNLASTNISKAIVKTDTGAAMSGGVPMYDLGVPGNARTPFKEQLMFIPPGVTLGFTVPLVLAANISFKVDFWEEVR